MSKVKKTNVLDSIISSESDGSDNEEEVVEKKAPVKKAEPEVEVVQKNRDLGSPNTTWCVDVKKTLFGQTFTGLPSAFMTAAIVFAVMQKDGTRGGKLAQASMPLAELFGTGNLASLALALVNAASAVFGDRAAFLVAMHEEKRVIKALKKDDPEHEHKARLSICKMLMLAAGESLTPERSSNVLEMLASLPRSDMKIYSDFAGGRVSIEEEDQKWRAEVARLIQCENLSERKLEAVVNNISWLLMILRAALRQKDAMVANMAALHIFVLSMAQGTEGKKKFENAEDGESEMNIQLRSKNHKLFPTNVTKSIHQTFRFSPAGIAAGVVIDMAEKLGAPDAVKKAIEEGMHVFTLQTFLSGVNLLLAGADASAAVPEAAKLEEAAEAMLKRIEGKMLEITEAAGPIDHFPPEKEEGAQVFTAKALGQLLDRWVAAPIPARVLDLFSDKKVENMQSRMLRVVKKMGYTLSHADRAALFPDKEEGAIISLDTLGGDNMLIFESAQAATKFGAVVTAEVLTGLSSATFLPSTALCFEQAIALHKAVSALPSGVVRVSESGGGAKRKRPQKGGAKKKPRSDPGEYESSDDEDEPPPPVISAPRSSRHAPRHAAAIGGNGFSLDVMLAQMARLPGQMALMEKNMEVMLSMLQDLHGRMGNMDEPSEEVSEDEDI